MIYRGAGLLFVSEHNNEVKFFLGKRTNFPRVWSVMGGKADEGEDHLTCAIRESKEELGVVLNQNPKYYKAFEHKIPFIFDWTTYLVKVDKQTFDKIVKPNFEFEDSGWFDTAPDNSHLWLPQIIKKIKKDWKTYSKLEECPVKKIERVKLNYPHFFFVDDFSVGDINSR